MQILFYCLQCEAYFVIEERDRQDECFNCCSSNVEKLPVVPVAD